jgi:hypothetical protein
MRILKADAAQQIVTGLVYGPPGECDSQGDYAADAATIEKAARTFMSKYYDDPRRFNINHKGPLEAWPVLQSFVTAKSTKIGGKTVPAGCWIMTLKVEDPRVWKAIAEKKLIGFSIKGEAET